MAPRGVPSDLAFGTAPRALVGDHWATGGQVQHRRRAPNAGLWTSRQPDAPEVPWAGGGALSPLVKRQLETGRQLFSASAYPDLRTPRTPSAYDLRTPRTPSTLPLTDRPWTADEPATQRSIRTARRSSRTARPATMRRSRSRTEMLENRRLSRVEEAVAATRGGGETAVFGRGDPALVLVPPGTFNRGVSDRDAGLIMFQREDEKRKIEEFYRGGLWGPFGGPCLTGPKVG